MIGRCATSRSSLRTCAITAKHSRSNRSTGLTTFFRYSLTQSPATWSYFYLTGAPYRAYLFRVGRRTQFWIVYTIDEETKTVNVLRFWNASKDPENFRA